MRKQRAVLLGDNVKPMTHRLTLHLQEKKVIVMEFNDRNIAQSMKDHFSVVLSVGNFGIREMKLEEIE